MSASNILIRYWLLVPLLVGVFGCQEWPIGGGRCNQEQYFVEEGGNRLVHFHEEPPQYFRCRVYESSINILNVLTYIKKKVIRNVSASMMNEVVDVCEIVEKHYFNSVELHGNSSRDVAYPGTKWCGPGNEATDYDDLGEYWEADMCCRKHDHCPDSIEKGKCKYDLCNNEAGTTSLCSCDHEFHDCLKKVQDKVSNAIGNLFFNLIGMRCFAFDHPIVKCIRWGGWGGSSCQEYLLDESQPKKWQFFDPQEY